MHLRLAVNQRHSRHGNKVEVCLRVDRWPLWHRTSSKPSQPEPDHTRSACAVLSFLQFSAARRACSSVTKIERLSPPPVSRHIKPSSCTVCLSHKIREVICVTPTCFAVAACWQVAGCHGFTTPCVPEFWRPYSSCSSCRKRAQRRPLHAPRQPAPHLTQWGIAPLACPGSSQTLTRPRTQA